jgi:SPP1 family phage portal protein
VDTIKTVDSVLDQTKLRFSLSARTPYQFENVEDLIDNKDDCLLKFLKDFETNKAPRIAELWSYYEGNNARISRGDRRLSEDMSDVRARHNFGRYVARFIQGYLTGVPITFNYDDGNDEESPIDTKLREVNLLNSEESHDSTIVLHLAIAGVAYELLYRNKEDEVRFVSLDPAKTFMIKDMTVARNPLAAVRFYDIPFSETKERVVILYTKDKIVTYRIDKDAWTKDTVEDHVFRDVPIIEHVNNETYQGDFETELDLIDLYDAAQSDTANYMADLNDAILLITGRMDTGDTDETPEKRLEYMRAMRRARLLQLIPSVTADGKEGRVDGKYIYKQYDVSGSESYKDRIKGDIHTFTNTPNLDDENFSGTQSGEAAKYKLFGLDQVRAIKERFLIKSLRKRYLLIANILSFTNELDGDFKPEKLNILFTPNLPRNVQEEIENAQNLEGVVSKETQLSVLSIVKNAKEEIEKMDKENASLTGYDFEQTATTGLAETDVTTAVAADSEALKALNGAQITSVLSILEQIEGGLLTPVQAKALLVEGLKLDEAVANKIVGD